MRVILNFSVLEINTAEAIALSKQAACWNIVREEPSRNGAAESSLDH
jgi:hypothetical protein